MKRLFSYMLATCVAVSSLTGIMGVSAAVVTEGYSKVVTETDFENGINKTEYENKYDGGVVKSELSASPVETQAHGKVVKLYNRNSSNLDTDHYLKTVYSLINAQYAKEMLTGESLKRVQKVKMVTEVMAAKYTPFAISAIGHVNLSTRLHINFLRFGVDGAITVLNSTADKIPYLENTWYRAEIYMDFAQNTYTAYLNGTKVADNLSMGATTYNYALSIGVRLDRGGPDTYVAVDRMGYYLQGDPAVVQVKPNDGFAFFPVVGGQIDIIFNHLLGDVQPEHFSVTTADGETVTGYTISLNANKATIRITEPLAFATTYKVVAKAGLPDLDGLMMKEDKTVMFQTVPFGVTAGFIDFFDESNTQLQTLPTVGEVKACASVYNPLQEDKTVTVAITGLDADGKFVTGAKSNAVVPAESILSVFALLDLDQNPEVSEIRAFAVDSISGTALLSELYATLKADGQTQSVSDNGEAIVTLNETQVPSDGIFISGLVAPACRKTILIGMMHNGETSAYIPLTTNADGSFSYTHCIKGSNEAEGKYSIFAFGKSVTNKVINEAFYNSQATKDYIVKAVGDANSVAEIETAVLKNKLNFNLSDSYFNVNGYQTILEQKPYTSFEQIYEMMKKAKQLLDQINTIVWTEYTSLITGENTVVLNGHSDYAYFNGLSDSQQNKIMQDVCKKAPFNSFAELRTKFASAVANFKEELQTGVESDKKSGGSGRGGVHPTTNIEHILAEKIPQKPEIPALSTNAFTDLDSVSWAKESILRLTDKGILSGDGAGGFRPLDTITREEFVKILVTALGMQKESAASDFPDVGQDRWSYAYVSSAYASGIVLGDAAGRFGAQFPVTRQDMATMIFRALSAAGKTAKVPDIQSTFADDAQIQDYAREAVYCLRDLGAILGMPDGSFAPDEYANRAQAAKIIADIITLTEGGRI